jgi:succinoglycan biosynthesis protein ExoM
MLEAVLELKKYGEKMNNINELIGARGWNRTTGPLRVKQQRDKLTPLKINDFSSIQYRQKSQTYQEHLQEEGYKKGVHQNSPQPQNGTSSVSTPAGRTDSLESLVAPGVQSQPLIAIAACTYRRPLMLDQCLRSLLSQLPPEGAKVEIVVVDNQPDGGNRDGIEALAGNAVHYVHEPRRGISHARNAALDAALALGAGWLAFIDDDETAPNAWLHTLWTAVNDHNAGAVHARVERRYPDGVPAWAIKKTKRREERFPEGATTPVAATNNVLFNLGIVADHGLRFNPDLGLTGGEDWEFFKRFTEAGGKIVWTNRRQATVTELVPAERISFRGQLREAFNRGFCDIRDARLLGHGIPRYVFKAVKRAILGVFRVLIAPVALLLGPARSMRLLLSGCRNIAQAAGTVFTVIGGRFSFYKNTTGF